MCIILNKNILFTPRKIQISLNIHFFIYTIGSNQKVVYSQSTRIGLVIYKKIFVR